VQKRLCLRSNSSAVTPVDLFLLVAQAMPVSKATCSSTVYQFVTKHLQLLASSAQATMIVRLSVDENTQDT